MLSSAFLLLEFAGKICDRSIKTDPFDFSEATVTSPVPDEDVTVASEKDELTLGEIINIKLVESGEKDNLMELVRDRLVESGRKDGMRHVKKKGRKDVAVDELIRDETGTKKPPLTYFSTRCCEARAAEQNSKLHWISCSLMVLSPFFFFFFLGQRWFCLYGAVVSSFFL
ncbi:unnamed protein product [Brassica oleracea]